MVVVCVLCNGHDMRGLRGRIETCFTAFLCYLHTARFAFVVLYFSVYPWVELRGGGGGGGSEWVCSEGGGGVLRTNL